jgi:hypothetical protein
LRICAPLASNKVNSREVRRVIEEIITGSEVKPEIIRFFRGAMFNMVRLYIYIFCNLLWCCVCLCVCVFVRLSSRKNIGRFTLSLTMC